MNENLRDAFKAVLENIKGENAEREGLQETPDRVARAWEFWTSGYSEDPVKVLKTFVDGSEGVDEMVVVKDLPFYSHCEHHLAPFFGTATIGYLPKERIVGLSKLGRLLQMYSRRLQVQERLTCQIANAIDSTLNPLGCGVIVRARHLCMESRGICQQGHYTVTSALRGVFKTEDSARSEFLGMK
jgi:GTP cyclohydrolase I